MIKKEKPIVHIQELTDMTSATRDQLLKIWEHSVRATHHFLSNEEIIKLKAYVPQAFSQVDHLFVARVQQKTVGFIGINDQKVEMLFVDSSARDNGYGKQLLKYVIQQYDINELAVNEQNPQAVGFYEHLGFQIVARSETDDQGQPYPILRLERIS